MSVPRARLPLRWLAGFVLLALPALAATGAEEEPPTIQPFGPVRQDRADAVPGYVELSDGSLVVGNVYLTRDKRLKIEDRQAGGEVRQREVPLRVVRQIETHVEKEWMEKEWRFKEAALNEKVYTGRSYPARLYFHTITLKDGREITGPLAEIVYVRPFASAEGPRAAQAEPEPRRFLLNKRDKGSVGTDLDSLLYVRMVKLGDDALKEGKQKASGQSSTKNRKSPSTRERK